MILMVFPIRHCSFRIPNVDPKILMAVRDLGIEYSLPSEIFRVSEKGYGIEKVESRFGSQVTRARSVRRSPSRDSRTASHTRGMTPTK